MFHMKHNEKMKTICPWCQSDQSILYLKLKDEFLTKEDFQIYECQDCGLLYTEPRPEKDKIGFYYQSEEYYSHQENKRGFIPKIYEMVKSINLRTKYKITTKGLPLGRVLDIGCGAGDFLHTMEQNGWQTLGAEPSEVAINIARKRIKGHIITPEEIANLPDESFEVITMWHVLEHVENLTWQIAQLKRLLKKGGRLVLALPNFKSFDAQYYKQYWAAYDVPRHLNHFCKLTVVKIFSNSGLKIQDTQKLYWDAFYISFMSEKFKKHSLPLLRGFVKGCQSNMKARQTGEWSSLVYIFEKK